jgi:hypothetical protein
MSQIGILVCVMALTEGTGGAIWTRDSGEVPRTARVDCCCRHIRIQRETQGRNRAKWHDTHGC